MQLIQVDIVRFQAPQARLRSRLYIPPPEMTWRDFRRYKYFVPDTLYCLPDDFFSVVGFSRVNERGAQFQSVPQGSGSTYVFPRA